MEQERKFTLSLRYYNVVLQPATFHDTDYYKKLMRQVFQNERAIVTATDKATKMRGLDESNDMMIGHLVNYSILSSKNWYDDNADTIIEHDTDPNLYPNAREWEFYFMPETHRMAVVVKKGLSWGQFETYLNKAFKVACESLGYDDAVLNRITSTNGIEAIYSLDTISSLDIEVCYSNNDNNDEYTEAIDDEFKSSNVSRMKAKVIGTSHHPIQLKKEGNSLLNSLLILSKNNGFAKAKGKIGKKAKTINTRDYPVVTKLTKVTDSNMTERIRQSFDSLTA